MRERGYVIGDLHLGAGPGDPLEDFRDDDVFADFCGRIAGPETTLLLNGDVIDFAQIPPFDVPKPAHLLWAEPASVVKVEQAISGHPGFFAALAELIARGGRVRYLVGNHDLDVVWPAVQARLAAALGGPSRDQLVFEPGASRFHGVHVEHGHHFTPENCPREPLAFVHEHDGVRYLERVWGTDFMLQFYNELERTHPFADNVKPMLTVVWHGLRKGWIGGRTLARLFLFLKRRGVPWRAIVGATLAGREEVSGAAAAAAFEDPAWAEAVLDRVRTDDAFVDELNRGLAELEPGEHALAADTAPVETAPPGAAPGEREPAPTTLGLFREDRELRAARERLAGDGVTHVVFGHTHVPLDGALDGRLFNYGTWLPSLDLKSPHVKAKIDREGLQLEHLRDDRLYTPDRRVVRIDADPTYEARVRLVPVDEA